MKPKLTNVSALTLIVTVTRQVTQIDVNAVTAHCGEATGKSDKKKSLFSSVSVQGARYSILLKNKSNFIENCPGNQFGVNSHP